MGPKFKSLRRISLANVPMGDKFEDLKLDRLQDIGDDFLAGSDNVVDFKFDMYNVQKIGARAFSQCKSMKRLTFTNCRIRSIDNLFCYGATSLVKLDMRGVTNMKMIESVFCAGCHSLEELDISNLTELKIIGPQFCSSTTNLKTIHWPDLSFLESIGNWFLEKSGLKAIDWPSTKNLNNTGRYFFNMSKVETLRLGDCPRMLGTQPDFLSFAENLTHLDLSGLINLTGFNLGKLARVKTVILPTNIPFSRVHFWLSINNFTRVGCGHSPHTDGMYDLRGLTVKPGEHCYLNFSNCLNLTSLNLSGLKLTGNFGLVAPKGGSSFCEVYLPDLSNSLRIDEGFLKNTKIRSFCLAGAAKLISIGDHFLDHSTEFISLDLSDCTSLCTIGSHFLNSAPKLVKLDLSGLVKLVQIDAHFLSNTNVAHIIMPPNLEMLGKNSFDHGSYEIIDMEKCTKFRDFDTNFGYKSSIKQLLLPNSDKVYYIPAGFLQAAKIQSVDFNGMKNITHISRLVLNDVRALKEIKMDALTKLEKIEEMSICNISSLRKISLPKLERSAVISAHFLSACGLESIDLTGFAPIEAGMCFLSGCANLKEITGLETWNRVWIERGPYSQHMNMFCRNCNKLSSSTRKAIADAEKRANSRQMCEDQDGYEAERNARALEAKKIFAKK